MGIGTLVAVRSKHGRREIEGAAQLGGGRDVEIDPHTTLLLCDHSIRGEKLVWCVGVYSPYVVYPNDVMCDSELFDHVSKIHKSNPTIHVYELANLFNCRHSKNRLFEFVCQYFESPKLIQFRTHRQTVSISPFICVKIDFLPENSVSNLYTRGIPHAVAKTQIYSLQHVLPAVTVPKHQGINST